MKSHDTASPRRTVRCAIYTRKSTDQGLEQQFNSLHAQREAAEAYIASQKSNGWVCLPEDYSDGGFSGGNMERPGLQRLVADIEAGHIDAVVVYKVDRLSRSLLDFARMMQVFEDHGVSFVSVTQSFSTAESMGRLTLNILLSFAQFEREMISERTRDKMAASRKKGLFLGGRPVLGYDLSKGRLTVNEAEATRVREIYAIYLETESLGATLLELDRRGWRSKQWTTSGGRAMGGFPFAKSRLYGLLTNVLYIGKVPHKGKVYPGEQPALVDESVWKRVQELLKTNSVCGGNEHRAPTDVLLQGLLRCKSCGRAMGHTYVPKPNCPGVRYRYYACQTLKVRGRGACSSRSVPAEELERFVLERVRQKLRSPEMATLVLDEVRALTTRRIEELEAEIKAMSAAADAERLIAKRQKRIATLRRRLATRDDVERELDSFDAVWTALEPRERAILLRAVVKAVRFNASKSEVSVTFVEGVVAPVQTGIDKEAA